MNWHFALIRYLMLTTILNAVLLAGTANANNSSAYQSGEDWPWYHGNPHATHYSTLDHINKKNVKDLKVAWTFDSGEVKGAEELFFNPSVPFSSPFSTSINL